MVFALVADVGFNPLQVFRSEGDHAIAALPFQDWIPFTQVLVGLVGGGPFQLADELADPERGWDGHRNVDVVFDAVDLVKDDAARLHNPLPNVAMDKGLDFGRQHRFALFGMPDDVQIDFRIMTGHGDSCFLEVMGWIRGLSDFALMPSSREPCHEWRATRQQKAW